MRFFVIFCVLPAPPSPPFLFLFVASVGVLFRPGLGLFSRGPCGLGPFPGGRCPPLFLSRRSAPLRGRRGCPLRPVPCTRRFLFLATWLGSRFGGLRPPAAFLRTWWGLPSGPVKLGWRRFSAFSCSIKTVGDRRQKKKFFQNGYTFLKLLNSFSVCRGGLRAFGPPEQIM